MMQLTGLNFHIRKIGIKLLRHPLQRYAGDRSDDYQKYGGSRQNILCSPFHCSHPEFGTAYEAPNMQSVSAYNT